MRAAGTSKVVFPQRRSGGVGHDYSAPLEASAVVFPKEAKGEGEIAYGHWGEPTFAPEGERRVLLQIFALSTPRRRHAKRRRR